ncbi:MocR-like pyridoxine biosynthesis transcription factor PdxR [Alkaliphilus serpentinus]|uniref:PLP-dependent aminotransferase family protein n=1 Tax=Alkaliphilus serpentinus TaxID=1482731 RepID=A0A833HMW0_9FIRM|nr:PLP-dependent aminotransferase family protein [Alkaliphilus serpentinus]KAB3529034.1 PLP-dependent aminotransferase family protein [Alkaliphilus serpentinus]
MKSFKDIVIDKDKDQHLYIQLYKEIKNMILRGQLGEEDRLPPVRKMANLLAVNNITVVKAYEILEQEGLVYKKIGSGTFISKEYIKDFIDRRPSQLYKEIEYQTVTVGQSRVKIDENMINFASGTPSAELFPIDEFKEVLNEVLDRDKGFAFDYQEGKGYYPLRQILVEYIKHYGIYADAENIQVISGAQQGIDIISKALLNYGDYVFVESPSYTGAMAAFHSRGARMIDIPLQQDGLDLKTLEKKIRLYHPKLIYLMPNFQNPTGISYSMEKKEGLLKLCKEEGVYIVEDDYLSELNFNDENNITLKALDLHQQVIYVKSFSKIFMPGLRLGFLVIPSIFNENLLIAKHATDISTSGLLQRAFELYLRRGIWQQHLLYMEGKYQERFKTMVKAIEKYLSKDVGVNIPSGGVNFWFKLPKGFSAIELHSRAETENIALAPGSLFFINNKDDGYFRLSIASVNQSQIEAGIKRLSRIIDEYLDNQAPKRKEPIIKPIL